MVIACRNNFFELHTNFKDAFNLAKLEEYYIEECLDKYSYIIGDLSDSQLRLKGLKCDNKHLLVTVNTYLTNSCTFECPFYILRKISSEEYKNRKDEKITPHLGPNKSSLVLTKENYDKESLILENSSKNKPNIIIDIARINEIKKGKLPLDLKCSQEVEEKTVTTISGSEGFVPQKRPTFKNKFNKKDNKKSYER